MMSCRDDYDVFIWQKLSANRTVIRPPCLHLNIYLAKCVQICVKVHRNK